MALNPTNDAKEPRKGAQGKAEKSKGFTQEERAAMQERAKELKAAARRGKGKADDEAAVVAQIAQMPEPDRALGKRVHEIIASHAPGLTPRLWYGMPAYAKDDKVVCFFQGAHKFKARYATLGFSDKAALDDGSLWPVAFALKAWTPAVEAKIVALVRKAASAK